MFCKLLYSPSFHLSVSCTRNHLTVGRSTFVLLVLDLKCVWGAFQVLLQSSSSDQTGEINVDVLNCSLGFHPILHNKISGWCKLKLSADDKSSTVVRPSQMMGFGFERQENIVGKGENTSYQHLLFFHNISKALLLKTPDCLPKLVKG